MKYYKRDRFSHHLRSGSTPTTGVALRPWVLALGAAGGFGSGVGAPLPEAPAATLRTTGFASRKGEGTGWTWPVWSGPLTLDVVRSALALAGLQRRPADPAHRALGIVEVYRARRLTIGKFRGFAPAQPI